jgi:hypothetical protein
MREEGEIKGWKRKERRGVARNQGLVMLSIKSIQKNESYVQLWLDQPHHLPIAHIQQKDSPSFLSAHSLASQSVTIYLRLSFVFSFLSFEDTLGQAEEIKPFFQNRRGIVEIANRTER